MSFIAISVVTLSRLISAYRDAARAQKQNRQPAAPLGLVNGSRHRHDKIGSYHRRLIKELVMHSLPRYSRLDLGVKSLSKIPG
jgi:hypothetical protein